MLTILTPTYNRQKQLSALYQSLCGQTRKDFEWLIIDDGSNDGTGTAVAGWKGADFPIRYIYRENGGKHRALNTGIAMADGGLIFIVDSDDTLTADAVETIYGCHERHGEDTGLCGYSFLRCFPDGRTNGKPFATDGMIANFIDARINSDDTHADKAEVFFTKCLKEFPFPEFPGEKFLGEDIVWIRMAMDYGMVHVNRAIYVGNYLDEGLTKNRRRHNIASPVGCMHRAREYMRRELKFRYRLKGALQYVIYGKFAGQGFSSLIKNTDHKPLVLLSYLPGVILWHKWGEMT